MEIDTAAPSLPRGWDNHAGQTRSHRASHFIKVHVFHKLIRMARTHSLHASDTVLIFKSSQNVLKAQI